MTEPLRLLPPRVAFVDLRTGQMSRDWYMFFQQLYERVGGASAPSNSDLAESDFEDAGPSELATQMYGLEDAFGQLRQQWTDPVVPDDQTPPAQGVLFADDQTPPAQCCPVPDDSGAELSALRAEVSELTKALDGANSSINQLNDTLAELTKEIDALKQATIGGQP